MAGVKGRSGRRAVPVAEHLQLNTFRPDRHGPLAELAAWGVGLAGQALVAPHLPGAAAWPERDRQLLAVAAGAKDRQAAAEAIVERDGLTIAGARGSRAAHPLLKVIQQCDLAMISALRAIDRPALEPPAPPPNPLDRYLPPNRRGAPA